MKFPTIKPRRPHRDSGLADDGYFEPDLDYVRNNIAASVWLLDNFEAALKAAYMMGAHTGYIGEDPEVTWPDDLAELRAVGINED